MFSPVNEATFGAFLSAIHSQNFERRPNHDALMVAMILYFFSRVFYAGIDK